MGRNGVHDNSKATAGQMIGRLVSGKCCVCHCLRCIIIHGLRGRKALLARERWQFYRPQAVPGQWVILGQAVAHVRLPGKPAAPAVCRTLPTSHCCVILEAMKPRKRSNPAGRTPAAHAPGKNIPRGQRGSLPIPRDATRSTVPVPASWRLTVLLAGLIVAATVAAYSNSFAGPFIYDDIRSIVENYTIRQFWPIWQVLSPPCNGETVGGRPLLNLSLAMNYAVGGLEPWGYHAANLAMHLAAALLLFGALRRTLLTPALHHRFGGAATPLALAGALLWAVHPLQTESVTYIVQRAESLMGFFYLLTLYCVIRGAGSRAVTIPDEGRGARGAGRGTDPANHPRQAEDRPRWPWYAAAVLACLLGMACKEVMVTAPLIVLLYDRMFLAGSFRQAWRRRWRLYLSLAATWGMLIYLTLQTGLVGRQSELGAPPPWSYARSQPGVMVHYLRLSVWPNRLCLHDQWPVASGLWEILPASMIVGLILAVTVWGLVGRKAYGFVGAWFFVILAPTSSILPLSQLALEHRMYLPLAAVAVLAVAGGYGLWDRLWSRPPHAHGRAVPVPWAAPVALLTGVLLALGSATVLRNSDYRSVLAIYQDTVDKRPGNPITRNSLGVALAGEGRIDEAIEHFQEALRLKPDYVWAHNNLGLALVNLRKTEEAFKHFREALRLKPDSAETHNNLGTALAAVGRTQEAIEHYDRALRLKPDYAKAHNNLGVALAGLRNTSQAIEHYRQAVRLYPEFAEAHYNLANVLAAVGATNEAIEHYHRALRLKRDYAKAQEKLAHVLTAVGKTDEAIDSYNQLLQRMPDSVEALNNLAWLLAVSDPARGGDPGRAVQLAQRAGELGGRENTRCLDTLAAAYAAAGRFDDAMLTADKAVQLAESAGQFPLAKAVRARLELYRAGRPYREAPRSADQPKPLP